MDIHDNARTTRHSRMLMVRRLAGGWSVAAVAQAQGVTPKTVRKWRDRHTVEGEAGLADRSSQPHRSPRRLAAPIEAEILALRRQRLTSPAIARHLHRPVSTIGQVLRRAGLGRLAALDPKPAIVRYQRETPGELIHIDIKKLGRIDGIGHRITGDRTGQSNKRGTGWDTSMSLSMTPRVWPTRSCCRQSVRKARCRSPPGRSRGSPGMVPASSAS